MKLQRQRMVALDQGRLNCIIRIHQDPRFFWMSRIYSGVIHVVEISSFSDILASVVHRCAQMLLETFEIYKVKEDGKMHECPED